jgi:hypothetical protein
MMDASTITISRDSGYADYLRDYRVLVDGGEIGRIANGQTKTFPLEPGSHQLVMKISWCSSNTVAFSLMAGESAHFNCGSNLRGIRLLLCYYYICFAADRYLWLGAPNKSLDRSGGSVFRIIIGAAKVE